MRNLSLHLIDEIQSELTRLETLNTCLEIVGAGYYTMDRNEMRGFMLDIAHFQRTQHAQIQEKLDACFPQANDSQGGAQ